MSLMLTPQPLTSENFAPFGDVLQVSGAPDVMINDGKCARYHDLARLDFSGGRAGISLFDAEIRHLPLQVPMVERHPNGSQAFIPMAQSRFLVVVAETPKNLRAFLTAPGQGVNLHRGTWHGVLTPLEHPGPVCRD